MQKSVQVSLYTRAYGRAENMVMAGEKFFFGEVTGNRVSDY